VSVYSRANGGAMRRATTCTIFSRPTIGLLIVAYAVMCKRCRLWPSPDSQSAGTAGTMGAVGASDAVRPGQCFRCDMEWRCDSDLTFEKRQRAFRVGRPNHRVCHAVTRFSAALHGDEAGDSYVVPGAEESVRGKEASFG